MPSWRDFVNCIMSFPCNMSFISLFVLILQHSPSFMGPYIFLAIYVSNILRVCVTSVVIVQVADP
jgi:hypothetical protein